MNIRDDNTQHDANQNPVIHRIMAEICSTIYHPDHSLYELIVRWKNSPILESIYIH